MRKRSDKTDARSMNTGHEADGFEA